MTRKNRDAELEMWPALFARLRQWFGAKRDMETTERDHARRWRDREREKTREGRLMHMLGLYLCEAEKAGAIQWQGLRRHDSPDDPTDQEEWEQEQARRLERIKWESAVLRQRAWQEAQDRAWLEATKDEREAQAKRNVEIRLKQREAARARAAARKAAKAAAS